MTLAHRPTIRRPRWLLVMVALVGAVLVGAVMVGVLTVVPASAHNVLVSTSPSDGQRVARPPAAVLLTFDEPTLAMGTQLVVSGPAGPVQQGPPRLVDNTVAQSLDGAAPAGGYTVSWRVTSADGHPISGTFTFVAEAAGRGQPAPTPAATAAPTPTGGPAWSTPSTTIWLVAGLAVVVLLTVSLVVARRRRG